LRLTEETLAKSADQARRNNDDKQLREEDNTDLCWRHLASPRPLIRSIPVS
jgi:hypothetical protein